MSPGIVAAPPDHRLRARHPHLPVIVDPSHGTGLAWMVPPMACAAVAAGADGLLMEVHGHPSRALSDGGQALTFEEFTRAMAQIAAVALAVGRSVS